jgi:alginate O-acetyltransferase complex protein AlgI
MNASLLIPLLLAAGAFALCPQHRPLLRRGLLVLSGLSGLAWLAWATMPTAMAATLVAGLAICSLLSWPLARRAATQRSRWVLAAAGVLAFAPTLAVQAAQAAQQGPWPLVAPISLGFFALRQLHLVLEARRTRKPPVSLVDWLAYSYFLPALLAGPLERLPRFVKQLDARCSGSDLGVALQRLLLGAFKKLVVADQLLARMLPANASSPDALDHLGWTGLLAACALRVLYVYVEFSGYTDMARGAARLFGIELMSNFDRPLLRSNLADFWRSWHISLSSFMRDTVFYPALVATRQAALAITLTMLAIAAWHGIEAGWWLWGLHHALGLIVLAAVQRRWLARPPLAALRASLAWRGLGLLATWFYVAAGNAFLWQPAQALHGLDLYLRLWTLGLWT